MRPVVPAPPGRRSRPSLQRSQPIASDFSYAARVRPLAALTLSALALGVAGCREAFTGFGPSTAAARQSAELAFGALAARFAPAEREAGADSARRRLYRNALVPSRAFRDTVVWTATPAADRRTLVVRGGLTAGGRYRLTTAAQLPTLADPGDSRHLVALTRLDEDEYRWNTGVDFALGPMDAPRAGAVFGRLLAAAEQRSERDIRLDYRAAAPRTSAAVGTLCTLDTIRPTALVDGSTMLALVVGIHPERLQKRLPKFAEWLQKYIATGRLQATVRDRGGAPWVLLDAREGRVRMQMRTLRGQIVPLAGPPRAMPDTLQLVMDARVKVKIFTVGFRKLVTDFVVVRNENERSWHVVARQEPEWELPLIAERLLRTPLRRPFQGPGASLRVGFRDVGGQTHLWRTAELAVQESAILRFLNGLGATMMGDFDMRAELERDVWLRELFVALRADVQALR